MPRKAIVSHATVSQHLLISVAATFLGDAGVMLE